MGFLIKSVSICGASKNTKVNMVNTVFFSRFIQDNMQNAIARTTQSIFAITHNVLFLIKYFVVNVIIKKAKVNMVNNVLFFTSCSPILLYLEKNLCYIKFQTNSLHQLQNYMPCLLPHRRHSANSSYIRQPPCSRGLSRSVFRKRRSIQTSLR